ncbi:MAG TPA: type II toxin-antitoxin system VapC family toxin [Candidatus Acidoferrum sp.]|nr:type II toxin-antitoxin system VapC family toxin [Candidatus Acidoferrum sp.]
MTIALDTNIIVALLKTDDTLNRVAQTAMEQAQQQGALVICGAVYAELLAMPGRTEAFVDRFCEDTHIAVEWDLREKIWREAGKAFQAYAARRRRNHGTEPRRLLGDFLIGAHAAVNGYRLLTLDTGIFRSSFPRLRIETV